MTLSPSYVFIVDDDEAVCDSLVWLIKSIHLEAQVFHSARAFLEAYDPLLSGCLILDVRMPEMSGLSLLQEIRQRGILLPVIMISGHGDVPMAVQAMKEGAMDFIEKPFNDQKLLDLINRAIRLDMDTRSQKVALQTLAAKLNTLSVRERQVMDLLVAGQANKEISFKLGIHIKTVEAHRAKAMHKMAAKSLVDLVRMVISLQR